MQFLMAPPLKPLNVYNANCANFMDTYNRTLSSLPANQVFADPSHFTKLPGLLGIQKDKAPTSTFPFLYNPYALEKQPLNFVSKYVSPIVPEKNYNCPLDIKLIDPQSFEPIGPQNAAILNHRSNAWHLRAGTILNKFSVEAPGSTHLVNTSSKPYTKLSERPCLLNNNFISNKHINTRGATLTYRPYRQGNIATIALRSGNSRNLKKYKNSTSLHLKRVKHNETERLRRELLSKHFDTLKNQVPGFLS
jgi:hypothetical protein